MKKIGIIGFGLIGGSIAKALKIKTDIEIVAYSRSEQPLIDGVNSGILTEYSINDFSIFADCNYIFICTPVDLIPMYVEKLLPVIDKQKCIITDVGSTKYEICKQMANFTDIKFIAGHPMAGSEQTGFNAANSHMFENAYYIIAPNANVTDDEIKDFTDMVCLTGALPLKVDPAHHDYIVAAISHVPHIIASALVATVKSLDDENQLMHTMAAGGFKDITRIASSSAEIWSSICFENKAEILKVLKSFSDVIECYTTDIVNDDKESLFDKFNNAKNYRDTFTQKRGMENYYSMLLNISDKKGSLAKIVTILSDNDINIKNIGIVNSREYTDGVLQIVFENKEYYKKSTDLLTQAGYKIYK